EVGYAKPHRAMFDSAARQMGVAIEEMVHVGDRIGDRVGDRGHDDVQGPRRPGIKAILFTAAHPIALQATPLQAADTVSGTADAVCERAADLPALIDRLAG